MNIIFPKSHKLIKVFLCRISSYDLIFSFLEYLIFVTTFSSDKVLLSKICNGDLIFLLIKSHILFAKILKGFFSFLLNAVIFLYYVSGLLTMIFQGTRYVISTYNYKFIFIFFKFYNFVLNVYFSYLFDFKNCILLTFYFS